MTEFTVTCPLTKDATAACADCVLFAGKNGSMIECRLPDYPQEQHGFHLRGIPANGAGFGTQYVFLVLDASNGQIKLAPPWYTRQRRAKYQSQPDDWRRVGSRSWQETSTPWRPPERKQHQPEPPQLQLRLF